MRDVRKVDLGEGGLRRSVTMREIREFVTHLSFLPDDWQVQGYMEAIFPTDKKFHEWPRYDHG